MKKNNAAVLLSFLLVSISFALYLYQLLEFRSPRDTAFYFLQDLAFLPLQVAIVTIVLGRILSAREKRENLKKVNMAISAFFSEAGTAMVLMLTKFNTNSEALKSNLEINAKWTHGDFQNAVKLVNDYKFSIDCRDSKLAELKVLLAEKRSFQLIMLENPNLMEHESFTDMLWAIFHLTDELSARDILTGLPDTDTTHLALDTKRALSTILVQWINHMEHLKSDYPYLFSLEVRRNPFKETNGVIIRE